MTAHTSWSERRRAERRPPWWSAWLGKRRVRKGLAASCAALAVLAVVGTVAARWRLEPRPEPSPGPSVGSLKLVEVGEIESAEVTPVYARASGEIVWTIDEGAQVQPGDAIVRIDKTKVREKLEEEERQLLPLKTELKRAERELEAVRTIGPLNVKLKGIQLARARWGLDDLVMLPTREQLVGVKLDLRAASLRREKTRRELERVGELGRSGLATKTELRTSRLRALNAEAEAELASLRFEIVKSGATKLSLESARLQVEKAKLGVDEADFLSAADITIREKAVEIARARLSKHERQIERRKRDLENCEIRAPVAGRVAFVEVWKGSSHTSRIEIGETCRWGQMLCKIADPGRVLVRVFVNEVDALRLRKGQRAVVRLTAFPGTEIEGAVVRIGVRASDKNERLGELALRKAGRAGVNVVKVVVELDRDLADFRGGYTAMVEIDLADALEPDGSTSGEERLE